jgi:hypothetical protein
MSFAVDNRIHAFNEILLTMIGRDNTDHCLKFLMFLEIFALDQDWDQTMLDQMKTFVRFKNNYRFLYLWL